MANRRAVAGPAAAGDEWDRAKLFTWDEDHERLLNPETGQFVGAGGRVASKILKERGFRPLGGEREAGHRVYRQKGIVVARGALRVKQLTVVGDAPVYMRAMVGPMLEEARAHGERFRGIVVRMENPADPNGTVFRTIRDFRDADELALRLAYIETGLSTSVEVNGSDPVAIGYQLDTSHFAVQYVIPPPRGGAANAAYKTRETPLWRLADYRGAEGDCLITILRHVSGKAKGVRCAVIRRELGLPAGPLPAEEEVLQKLADYFRVEIEVVTSDLEIEREFIDGPTIGNTCVASAEPICVGRAAPRRPSKGFAYIHLDVESSHYEHILEAKPITLCAYTGDHAVYTKKQLRERILAQGRTFYWCGRRPVHAPRVRRVRDMRRLALVFDFETTYDAATMRLDPYAASWFAYEIDRTDADFSAEEANVALGDDCVDKLLDFILSAPNDVTYTIIGFNNARFDNFLLAQAAAAREALSDVFFASGMLRDLRIGRHSTIDLCKLCPMSLALACKSFATSPSKIDGFSHEIPQAARLAGRLPEWIAENQEKLVEYVTTDVLAACSLAVKLEAVFDEVVQTRPVSARIGTIGGVAWHSFKEVTGEMPEPPIDEAMDRFIRSALTGGRTQNFEAPGFTTDEPCRMVDVCSLYPTAMSGAQAALMPPQLGYGRYPLGQANTTTEYVEGKLGFYNVRVVRQPVPNVLPRRVAGQPLDWKCTEPFETIAGTPSIELIRLAGGEVEVLVQDGIAGYYYPRDTDKLFDTFLGPIIAGKSAEDAFKEHKDPRYNPARREALKLIMNSLCGKWAQANYDDCAMLVKGSAAQLAAEKKMRDGVAEWYPIHGDVALLVGKKDKQYKPKYAKPVQVAALIYEHARSYMWWIVYSRYNPIYTDTDSALVRRADYDRFRLDFPQLNPDGRLKELGDLEEELESDSTHVIVIAPKMYYVEAAKKTKDRAKGVSLDKDMLVSDRGVEQIRATDNATIAGWYRDGCPEMIRLKNARRAFFELIRDTGHANVLSSSLRRGVDAAGFYLEQRFVVKTITNPLRGPQPPERGAISLREMQKEETLPPLTGESLWDGAFDDESAAAVIEHFEGGLE